MYCVNCGTKLEDKAIFCTNCGCKVENQPQQNFGSEWQQPVNVNQPQYLNNPPTQPEMNPYISGAENEKSFTSLRKKILIGGACVCGVALLCVGVFSVANLSGKNQKEEVFVSENAANRKQTEEKAVSTKQTEEPIVEERDEAKIEEVQNGKKNAAASGNKVEADIKEVLSAYDKYVHKNCGLDMWNGYSLIYMDDDIVPELVVHGSCEANGNIICYYVNGQVKEQALSRLYFSYMPRKNLLCNSDGNMGVYHDKVYKIKDGGMVQIAEGDYVMEDIENAQYDNATYEYEWNGKKVSESVYNTKLSEVYSGKGAESVSDLKVYDSVYDAYDGLLNPGASASHKEDVDAYEYILPNSASEYLTKSDLKGLSAKECRLARNEIYARHGRRFQDEELQKYFDSCSWYEGTIEPEDFQESMLNEYEKANRDLISSYEQKK